MKKSIWSILVIVAALMLSSCGKDNENENTQFGIYSAFVSDANNPVALTSTDTQMQLFLFSDGNFKVTGISNQTGRYGVSGSVLSLEGFGQGVPVDTQSAGINANSPFTGNFGTGTQNYGACIQVNITSASFFGNQNFNNQGGFGTNNTGTNTGTNLKYFCR